MAKITDPSKLLPSAKSTAITKIGKANFTSPLKISKKSTSITKGLLGESNQKDAVDVNNKLVKVEKFFQSDLLVSKKKAESKRKEKEKQDFKKEEEKLEAPKEAKKFNLPSLSLPGMSFLDRIKRFLFFTALGWIFTRFQDQLPKLLGVVKLIGGVYGVAEDLFGKMFNGFMSLVKFGGDLKDKTIGFIAQLGGGEAKDFQKRFDALEKQFNDFANLSIIAGLVGLDLGLAGLDEYNKQKARGKQPSVKPPIGGGPSVPYKYDPKRALVRKKYGDAAAKIYDNQISNGKTPLQALKNIESRYIKKGRITPARMTGSLGGTDRGSKVLGRGFRKAVKRGAVKTFGRFDKILKGPFAKLKGPLSKFAGAAVPGLGAAVGAADAAARFKSGDKVGGTLASVSAALDAATAAAALTGIGLPIAGILGGISISIDVLLLIRDIVKTFFPFIPMFSGGGRVVGKYQGGGAVTRGGKPQKSAPSRTLKIEKRRPPKIQPKQSQPGKDVGGKQKIRELYPDPSVKTSIEGQQKNPWIDLLPTDQRQRDEKLKKLPNPYKALTNTAKVLKDIPFGIGALMGGAVDIALGQKLDKDAIKGLSGGISYLITSIANKQISSSISNIEKEVSKMETGGMIRGRSFTRSDEVSSDEGIMKALDKLIYRKVDQAIKEVQKQLMPGRFKERPAGEIGPSAPPSKGPGGGPGPGPSPTGENGRLSESVLKSVGAGGCRGGCRLWKPAAEAYLQMKAAAAKDKINFQLESAYRSYEHQKELYDAYKRGTGNLAAAPGTSDHGLGKAIDLYPTAAQDWVRAKGRQYGWYWPPETGEPWHFVYVGGGRLEPQKPQTELPKQQPQIPDAQNYGIKDGEQRRVEYEGQNYVIARDKGKWRVYKVNKTTGLLEELDRTDQSFLKVLNRYRRNESPTSPKPQKPPGQPVIPTAPRPTGQPQQPRPTGQPQQPSGSGRSGKASWYGPGFEGQLTSAGETFRTSKLTAAIQWDLRNEYGGVSYSGQLYYAKVTNVKNGKSVVVKINDVGPLKSGRIIDLSRAAFEKISTSGTTSEGILNVTVQKMGPAPREKSRVASAQNQDKDQIAQTKLINDFSKVTPYFNTADGGLGVRPAALMGMEKLNKDLNDENVAKMQSGGNIPKQSPNRNVSSLRSYPSYADGGMMIAIQPMIIEKPVPVPMGRGGGISFPIAGVNNSTGNTPSLSKG